MSDSEASLTPPGGPRPPPIVDAAWSMLVNRSMMLHWKGNTGNKDYDWREYQRKMCHCSGGRESVRRLSSESFDAALSATAVWVE